MTPVGHRQIPASRQLRRPKCGLRLFSSSDADNGGNNIKRSHEINSDDWNLGKSLSKDEVSFAAFLAKRLMTLPLGTTDAQMNAFMVEEGASPLKRVVVRNTRVDKKTLLVNNAAFSADPGRPRGGKAFSYSIDHLGGCTALAIVSETGIYAGHYWEDVGFNLDPEIALERGYRDQADAFQRSIIDALHTSVPGHTALAGAVADIIGRGDNIKAFLMVPDEGPGGEEHPYADAWAHMQAEIGMIIPRLQDTNDINRWQVVPYHPVQDEEREFDEVKTDANGDPWINYDPLDDTFRGRMLIKYDPDHEGQRKLAVWIENTQYYNNMWTHRD